MNNMNKRSNILRGAQSNNIYSYGRRTVASIVLSLSIAAGVAGAPLQCDKEVPVAEVFGQVTGGGVTKDPIQLLRDRCQTGFFPGSDITESTLTLWTAPTRDRPYPEWMAVCFHPATDPNKPGGLIANLIGREGAAHRKMEVQAS
jgi:hypothetical protein